MVLSSATTVEEAVWLEAHGCDAIIAQGFEAGGHRGLFLSDDLSSQLGTMALVPQVVDAVRVPVIAAGGIADGRGIAAALALGAAAVQIGTAFLFCPEAQLALAPAGIEDGTCKSDGHHQRVYRPAGARDREPQCSRARADVRRGAGISARRGRARAVAREVRAGRIGRFHSALVRPGGASWPRARRRGTDQTACRRNLAADRARLDDALVQMRSLTRAASSIARSACPHGARTSGHAAIATIKLGWHGGALMTILDSQVHAYEANTAKRPWHNVPELAAAHVTGDEMVAAMDKVGVDGAIFISPLSLCIATTPAMQWKCSRAHPDRFGYRQTRGPG